MPSFRLRLFSSRFRLSPVLLSLSLIAESAVACGVNGVAQDRALASQQAVKENASVEDIQRLIDQGKNEDVLKALAPMATHQPVPAGVSRLQGEAYYLLGRFPEANTAFKDAIEQDPKDLESIKLRGLALFQMGRPADAIPLLTKAQAGSPSTRADPGYVLTLSYLDTHRYDDARRTLAAQYGFPPESAQAYLLTARMLLRRDFLPTSQEYARKAIEADPQLPLEHELLGEIFLAGNHLEEAIAELEQERARNPLDAAPYDRLGDAYLRVGNYAMAGKILQQAILLDPLSTGPYSLLGKASLKQQLPADAVTFLERAEKMDPGNYMAHWLLGQAYRSEGRSEDAAREVRLTQKLHTATEPKLQGVQ
jgi:tetratricopeptide (TPR) repeat protein